MFSESRVFTLYVKYRFILVVLFYLIFSIDLAINRFLENPAFLNYLSYLEYWRSPVYAKYIVYPHALAFLTLIQQEAFQTMIKREDFMTHVHSQQFYHWQHYLNNRQTKTVDVQEKEENNENEKDDQMDVENETITEK